MRAVQNTCLFLVPTPDLRRNPYPHLHVVVSSSALPVGFSGEAPDAPQPHLRIFAARALAGPPPVVLPAEQAYVEVEADDLKLTAIGGLE